MTFGHLHMIEIFKNIYIMCILQDILKFQLMQLSWPLDCGFLCIYGKLEDAKLHKIRM